jgi:hypothetical protein
MAASGAVTPSDRLRSAHETLSPTPVMVSAAVRIYRVRASTVEDADWSRDEGEA